MVSCYVRCVVKIPTSMLMFTWACFVQTFSEKNSSVQTFLEKSHRQSVAKVYFRRKEFRQYFWFVEVQDFWQCVSATSETLRFLIMHGCAWLSFAWFVMCLSVLCVKDGLSVKRIISVYLCVTILGCVLVVRVRILKY